MSEKSKTSQKVAVSIFIVALSSFIFLCGTFGFYLYSEQLEKTRKTVNALSKFPAKNVSTDIELWYAKGFMQLPDDNSFPEKFISKFDVSQEQQDYFRRIVFEYRNEIEEIANPKTAYSLIERKGLKIEISPFEEEGAELEAEMRDKLLKHFSNTQLNEIKTEINLLDPFYGFGQYSMTIEFGYSNDPDEIYFFKRSLKKGLTTKTESWGFIEIDKPLWKFYDNKLQELLLNNIEQSVLDDSF